MLILNTGLLVIGLSVLGISTYTGIQLTAQGDSFWSSPPRDDQWSISHRHSYILRTASFMLSSASNSQYGVLFVQSFACRDAWMYCNVDDGSIESLILAAFFPFAICKKVHGASVLIIGRHTMALALLCVRCKILQNIHVHLCRSILSPALDCRNRR